MTQNKVVLLVTVHRRYAELERNLAITAERFLAELGHVPPVVIVWACPEVGRLWIFQKLQRAGLCSHLIKRAPLPGESNALGVATTHFESANIRAGLEFVLEMYGPETLVCMQTADVSLQEGTVGMFLHEILRKEHRAVVFHWANGVLASGVWHTNCWALRVGERELWPPTSNPDSQDVLERQWGRALEAKTGVFGWHNAGERRFLHRHESEHLEPPPFLPQPHDATLSLACRGYLPWYSRLWRWLNRKADAWYVWFGEPVWPQEEKKESARGQ